MEKYYLIRLRLKATENNHRAGAESLYIYGKNDFKLLAKDTYNHWYDRDMMRPYFIREHGYKRLCDAKRNWSYNHPENSKFWTTTADIITVEIDNDTIISGDYTN